MHKQAGTLIDLKNIQRPSQNLFTDHQQGGHSSTEQLPQEWIKDIFKVFGSIYGHLWSSRATKAQEWQTVANDWAVNLAGMTYVEVRRALSKLPPMPPSAPQFRLLGNETVMEGRTHHQAYKEWRPERQLPKPVDNEKAAAAAEARAAIFAKLGIKR